MPITYDTSTLDGTSGTNTLTVSHTIGSGSNRCLIATLGIIAGGARTLSSITYNGTAMTLIGHFPDGDDNRFVSLYYMDEANLPAAGSYDIVSTYSGNGNIKLGGVSLFGVAQTGEEAISTGADAFDDLHNDTITTITNNAWVVQCTIVDGAYDISPDDGQTERQENTESLDHFQIATLEVASAGATNIGCSWGTNASLSTLGAAFAPAAAIGGLQKTSLPLLGVGA